VYNQILLIKKLAIIAMFSDDELMDLLVLKGGNAIDLIHNIALRSSKDVDFSIENEISKEDLFLIESKITASLKVTFQEAGFEVFDLKFLEKPTVTTPDMAEFWGGYSIQFKIIELEKYNKFRNDPDSLRRNAAITGPNNKRNFSIDISKYEFCSKKQEYDLDGYTIYVYTPEMILFEKLRAICQQMPEYREIVKNPSQSARARDFFDIFCIWEQYKIDVTTKENIELLKNIFQAKRVPIEFIRNIQYQKEFHRADFPSVIDTVRTAIDLKTYDFYFDYTLEKIKPLEALGIM